MRDEALETIEYKGYRIKIHADQDSVNPRKDWDQFGTMVCFHRRYVLGDKDVKGKRQFSDPTAFQEWLKEDEEAKGAIVLPLYLYDHSGITISCGAFSCPWDSGQVGYVFCTRADILKEFGAGKKKIVTAKMRAAAEKLLRQEVETYDYYLTGQCYGYTIDRDVTPADQEYDGYEREWEETDDSCWGFLGEMKYCIDEAKSSVDYMARKDEELQARDKAHGEYLTAARERIAALAVL